MKMGVPPCQETLETSKISVDLFMSEIPELNGTFLGKPWNEMLDFSAGHGLITRGCVIFCADNVKNHGNSAGSEHRTVGFGIWILPVTLNNLKTEECENELRWGRGA